MSADTIKIHKMIDDVLVPLELKRQRFEQSMERIDTDVNKGASKRQILKKYSDYIVNHGDDALDPVEETEDKQPVALKPAEKKVIVQKAIDDNPEMTLGQIIKHVAAHHPLTEANVRYIASNIMK